MSEPSEQGPPDGGVPDLDPRVGRALRELPPAAASPAFTDGVLARVSAPRARRVLLPALLAAAAAVAIAVFARGPTGGRREGSAPGSDPTAAARVDLAAELARLRREQRELAEEIETQRALEEEPSGTVIYVGQRAGVDLVLDLARFETAVQRTKAGGRP
jgi:hypothetical protein